MNKLIMAALWCFSVAAYADIYVCESEISEEIVAPNVLTGNYINKEVTKYFVVDSETGVRESNGNKHTDIPFAVKRC